MNLWPLSWNALILAAVLCQNASTPGQSGSIASALSVESDSQSALQNQVELRGRVVCLPETMHRLHGTDLASNHPHVYALHTVDGAFYTLLPTKFSEALLVDEKVRQRELLLKGRVFPSSHILEVMRTRSIRDDAVYDLFYYCTVCAIETVSPGPCDCCQGAVELTERPLRQQPATSAVNP